MYSVTVPGEPKAKGRPKVARFGKGGFVKMYSPKKTVEYENLIRLFFAEQNPGAKLIEGPVSMTIGAHFGIPKSASKKQQEAMLLDEIRPTKRPDSDNIIKIFADSLNGIAYKDDSQICMAYCEKAYRRVPKCICLIGAMRGGEA